MRFVDFTEVVIRQTEEDRVQVIYIPRIVVAKTVCSVTPGAMPSELKGPQGQIITTPAAYLHFPGEKVLVTCTEDEALYKLKWESVFVEPPNKNMKYLDPGDTIITRTINKPKPSEKKKSSIIS